LFIILLDNAVKYSDEKSSIEITTKQLDNGIQISVTDHGHGIEEKDLPYIFDRFYRVDSARTKTDISGYGLGLAIAKQIAETHNGSITVKSVIKKGSIFTVTLPISRKM
jgi:signal transduction histidine kinase